jgi:hypothetical protein
MARHYKPYTPERGVFLGFAGYYAVRLCHDRARAERVASLLVDPRWPWPPHWATFGKLEPITDSMPSRKAVGTKGRDLLVQGLTNPELLSLRLYRHSKETSNHAHADVESGQEILVLTSENPFTATGQTRGHELPEGARIAAWVELVHELMVALDVANAVIPVWPTATAVMCDTTFLSFIYDTRWGETSLGPPADFALQNDRENYWRSKLGGTYVRYPRWGTTLRRSHLEQIGGLARIRDEVAPARIVELGELAFIQLTDDPATALTAECEHKRRALEAVMAPIIVPPRPTEQG